MKGASLEIRSKMALRGTLIQGKHHTQCGLFKAVTTLIIGVFAGLIITSNALIGSHSHHISAFTPPEHFKLQTVLLTEKVPSFD